MHTYIHMTLSVYKVDGRGLSNTVCYECLEKKMLAIEGAILQPSSSNKMEQFSFT